MHYNHRSHEDKTALALIALCRQLPHHEHWMQWHSALTYYMTYVKSTLSATAPYAMLPSGVYSMNEMDDRNTFGLMHPIFSIFSAEDAARQRELTFHGYAEQLQTGVKLNDQWYLRRFPVWYSFRGNFHVQLSLGKGVAAASIYLNDTELYNVAQEQLAWILGKNPFSESMMFGVGYDYGTQYAVLHGDTVGAMPVGLQSLEEGDAPFWPQASNATYREIWMAPAGKWMAMMADEYLPGVLCGTAEETVKCIHEGTGQAYEFQPRNHRVEGEVPAGRYMVHYRERTAPLTVVAGGRYALNQVMCAFDIKAVQKDDTLYLTLMGYGDAFLQADNVLLEETSFVLSGQTEATGRISSGEHPWEVVLRRRNTGEAVGMVYGV